MSIYFQLQLSQVDTFDCMCEGSSACKECNGSGIVKITQDIAEFDLGNSSKLRPLRGNITEQQQPCGSREISLPELASALQIMSPLPLRLRATLQFLTAVCPEIHTKLTLHWS